MALDYCSCLSGLNKLLSLKYIIEGSYLVRNIKWSLASSPPAHYKMLDFTAKFIIFYLILLSYIMPFAKFPSGKQAKYYRRDSCFVRLTKVKQ